MTSRRATRIQEYLAKRADLQSRPLESGPRGGIDATVVIPVLAEYENIFQTLNSLSLNDPEELRRTLVICAVNNRASAPPAEIENNQRVLAVLRAALDGRKPPELSGALERGLRVACVDASSPGRELSEKHGVGAARKIGMDWALETLDTSNRDISPKLFDVSSGYILSLDADTIVDQKYLASARGALNKTNAWAAVFPFAHRLDQSPRETAAIVCYEIFLRYYVAGLAYARSPYAFHTIGSALACRAEAYAAISGMNLRQAGEDFYFLQQLAKTGPVAVVPGTVVHPSSRASHRVPFGTGQRVRRYLAETHDEHLSYDPRSFQILRDWLALFEDNPDMETEIFLKEADEISPILTNFLRARGFAEAWPKLRNNAKNPAQLLQQFHRWFDGFNTLKLIHALRDEALPPINIFKGYRALLEWSEASCNEIFPEEIASDTAAQLTFLERIRLAG
jgi:hypothetical protein